MYINLVFTFHTFYHYFINSFIAKISSKTSLEDSLKVLFWVDLPNRNLKALMYNVVVLSIQRVNFDSEKFLILSKSLVH